MSIGNTGDPLRHLYRRTYGLRVLGMGLGALPIATVLHQRGAGWPAWAWMVLVCLAWPHLAYVAARGAGDPAMVERRNLLADSFLAGTCVPLMHFNLLPSAVLVAVVAADKVTTGIRGLWLRSLAWTAAGVALGGLPTGFAIAPVSTMPVVIASLPILVIHTLVVSVISYTLVRQVQRQNLRLKELAHTDPLTGLHTRRHWEQGVATMLSTLQPDAQASLLLIDLDDFKVVNDSHGHPVGDDVLRAIGVIVRERLGDGRLAGRLGGDEIALALPVEASRAATVAEAIRADIEGLRFPQAPGLRCTVSIGIAPRPVGAPAPRLWIEAADRALYGAKDAGRNRIGGVPGQSLPA
ncbi:MAG: diguanylate cyclase [Xanthomonadaceae bacterium]|nr:diguanylate cyclase [Xanthomonadaceae bacterium]MDE1965311.1 diguanylate cyclase [Xanthomonadaceae bacterium]